MSRLFPFFTKILNVAKLIKIPIVKSENGRLLIQKDLLPGGIKSVFFIQVHSETSRGDHHHKITTHALICPSGSCEIYTYNGTIEHIFKLDSPPKCLILNPEDWRRMYNFSNNTSLLCLSNTLYNPDDYITTPYR